MENVLQRPLLNTFDLPELMDGAYSGATNVQRVAFERRCHQIWADDKKYEAERSQEREENLPSSEEEEQLASFCEMFPIVDPILVRTLYYELGAELCCTQLIALSESAEEPSVPMPEQKIGLDDQTMFPSLTDSQGWEVVCPAMLEQKDPGTQWRDCCGSSKDLPTEVPAKNYPKPRPKVVKKKIKKENDSDEDYEGIDEVEIHRLYQERRAARKGWGKRRMKEEEEDVEIK